MERKGYLTGKEGDKIRKEHKRIRMNDERMRVKKEEKMRKGLRERKISFYSIPVGSNSSLDSFGTNEIRET